jgi:uncharacterized protein YjbI with pentapeptide repeats
VTNGPLLNFNSEADISAPSRCIGQEVCKYKGGLKPSAAELADILNKNAAWIRSDEAINDPRIANLCGADLSGAHLNGAHLRGANLNGADLAGAHLNGADLVLEHLAGADLVFADLKGAHLSDAHLRGADLSVAHLSAANLNGADLGFAHLNSADLRLADLTGANLNGAHLRAANLNGAHLAGAHLTNADLSLANVADAYFDFDPESPPKVVPGIDNAWNLELVKFSDQPAGLVKLRGEFKELGMRTQEAKLTCAIRRSELSRRIYYPDGPYVHSWFERYFNNVFFDWTCQYGMSPGRSLLIVAGLAVILSIVYIFAQVNPGPTGGIWAVWDEHRIEQTEGSKEPQQLTDGFPSGRSEIGFFLLALYFSFLSATRIGWRELNVGTWVTRIQPREYSLRATGWVRVVSGVQSLISVYLVALAILAYFTTPFEY